MSMPAKAAGGRRPIAVRCAIFLVLLPLVTGCSPYPRVLEPSALQLRAGMTTDTVARLFSDCRVLAGTGTPSTFKRATVVFSTNANCAAWMELCGKNTSSDPLMIPESCAVFFDQDGRLIAYQYVDYDGQSADVEKHRRHARAAMQAATNEPVGRRR